MTDSVFDIVVDEFTNPNDEEFSTHIYGENLNQASMKLGDRVKLSLREMVQLKEMLDSNINIRQLPSAQTPLFNVNYKQIPGLRIKSLNAKLHEIPVSIENIEGRILAKVGPCDLSGVGGHKIREEIIKDLVNQALIKKGLSSRFEDVNVSACVGVRGRAQVFCSWFSENRETPGSHMNAYVKTAGESGLVHWEPRQGPQRWYNDTICAMATSVVTSIFEQGIRENTIQSSSQATIQILKNPELVSIFDRLLLQTKDRVSNLLASIKQLVMDAPSSSL